MDPSASSGRDGTHPRATGKSGFDHFAVPRYHEFTDNEIHDRFPDLAGAGSFAWLQGPPMHEEVHYWNESMHSESVISDGCCPASDWSNDSPSAHDGAVVWRSYHQAGSEGHKAHLWDGGITDLTDEIEAGMAIEYSLFEGSIAYEYGASPTRIRYWDGSTVTEVGTGFNPSLYNGAIAYEVWDGLDWEIHYWDGTAVHEITDNDINYTQASLHGSMIAWEGRPSGGIGHIYYVSLTK